MKRPIHLNDQTTFDTLFDEKPIEIGGFILRSRSVDTREGIRPSIMGWQAALAFASAAEESAPYWVGDLLAYADDRADWREKMEQAKTATKLAEQTLHNYTTTARKVKGRARQLAPSSSHARLVTKLEPAEQEEWLGRARDEGWTVSEFNKEMRAAARTRVIEGQAVLAGMFRVFYSDPPYEFNDNGMPLDGSLGKAERHYDSLSLDEIMVLPIESHAMDDAVLFQWAPPSMIAESLAIGAAWGFTYKTNLTWDKVLGNWGPYVRIHHEHLMIFTRGSCLPDHPTPMPDSVQVYRKSDVHSEKPEEFRKLITQLYSRGPYVELFARKPVEGWTVFGNDARLWSDDARASA